VSVIKFTSNISRIKCNCTHGCEVSGAGSGGKEAQFFEIIAEQSAHFGKQLVEIGSLLQELYQLQLDVQNRFVQSGLGPRKPSVQRPRSSYITVVAKILTA